MGWKDWPYWLRFSIVFNGIMVLLMAILYIGAKHKFFDAEIVYGLFFYFALILGLLLNKGVNIFLSYLITIVIVFVIGAIIGKIIDMPSDKPIRKWIFMQFKSKYLWIGASIGLILILVLMSFCYLPGNVSSKICEIFFGNLATSIIKRRSGKTSVIITFIIFGGLLGLLTKSLSWVYGKIKSKKQEVEIK